jgi:DTW domain-containing protein YfiP
MTVPLRPSRCSRCALPEPSCLCAEVTPFDAGLDVEIIRHVFEEPKTTNTARIAALALTRCRLHRYGAQHARFDPACIDWSGAALLFPGGTDTPGEVRTLVVLDGSWLQASGMFRRLGALRGVPRVSLTPPVETPSRLRDAHDPHRLGTLEALVGGLHTLGRHDAADRLDAVRRLHVARILATRGRRHPHVRMDEIR